MFTIAFKNVLMTLFYILPGVLLGKWKKASAEHLPSLSAVLIYVCSPCMIIGAYLQMEYSPRALGNMGLFFVITLVLQIAFMGLLRLILRDRFKEAKYKVLTVAAVMGNVGFFGLPIVRALFPENPEVMCYSSVYVFSMNLLAFTVGVFCLTGDKKFLSLKSLLLNPTTVSTAVALPLFLFGVGPRLAGAGLTFITDAIGLLGGVTTPLCMIILGIRLTTVRFRSLFTRPIVWLACLAKLVLFPLFCYLAVYFLPLDTSLKASVLVLSSVPCASVVFNLAEIHHGESELAANCLLVSTLVCFLTIPLLALLL